MTPDSDTYLHILLNGLLWIVMLLGPIAVMSLVVKMRDAWKGFKDWEAEYDAQHSNVVPLQGGPTR